VRRNGKRRLARRDDDLLFLRRVHQPEIQGPQRNQGHRDHSHGPSGAYPAAFGAAVRSRSLAENEGYRHGGTGGWYNR
jgi:hypothetical protein